MLQFLRFIISIKLHKIAKSYFSRDVNSESDVIRFISIILKILATQALQHSYISVATCIPDINSDISTFRATIRDLFDIKTHTKF